MVLLHHPRSTNRITRDGKPTDPSTTSCGSDFQVQGFEDSSRTSLMVQGGMRYQTIDFMRVEIFHRVKKELNRIPDCGPGYTSEPLDGQGERAVI